MLYSSACLRHSIFYLVSLRINFHLIQVILIVMNFQNVWCFMIDGTYFFGFNHAKFIHHIVNNSIFLWFLWKRFLGMVSLPWYLVGWYAAYLVPNLPKTLHSSEECPAPWIINVFDALFELSTYCLCHLPVLPYFAGKHLTRHLLLSYSY